ncbi:hypothetical protein E1B28_005755 [Marasmius oreades]|uniref:NADH:flavin oxidoreductase/NADH oxidase N-terminal domain-containing protein n=1 Tax=Marasmius oreades TaxID=181124 RepID=A0A9P7UW89_9AGAR|nr:uncharacterized protein E1B28_005755 [Marasmius oreades]KAG7094954.1 hypothetical protein E1B28_005755 [Marasmius oreades]
MEGEIFSEIRLPCGRKVQNRLVKVALYEHLSHLLGGPPNEYHFALYSTWSKANWGMILTGNVQVSRTHLTLGRDMVVPSVLDEKGLHPYRKLAEVIHEGDGTLAIMQLSHAGRQSCNFLGGRYPFIPPLAPSAIPVASSTTGIVSWLFHRLLFQTPRAMSSSDVEGAISDFIRGAELAILSGFDGVQLHVAHGYLLAQFMSPKSNKRTDTYACHSLALLQRIISGIRKMAPSGFILGLKLNTSDYSVIGEKSVQEERVLEHLLTLASWGTIDFIEISGGDYDNPEFMQSASTSPRQVFFANFSSKAVRALSSAQIPSSPLILLTGGLRSPGQLLTALSSKHAHLLGVGRASILCPDLPLVLRYRLASDTGEESYFPFKPEPDLRLRFNDRRLWSWLWILIPKINLVGAGLAMAWYGMVIRGLASRKPGSTQTKPRKDHYSVGGLEAILRMWIWPRAPELLSIRLEATVIIVILGLISWVFSALRR